MIKTKCWTVIQENWYDTPNVYSFDTVEVAESFAETLAKGDGAIEIVEGTHTSSTIAEYEEAISCVDCADMYIDCIKHKRCGHSMCSQYFIDTGDTTCQV